MASAIVDLCHAASKVTSSALLDSNPLQHVNACFHVVNSTIKRRDGIIEIVQSRMLQELVACVQSLQINLISGCSQVDTDELLYWYYSCLNSCYACFTYLRTSKLSVPDLIYYETLLNVTATSLKTLYRKKTEANILLALLLRIVYISQKQLPPDLSLVDALVPFFQHQDYCVQVASRNAAHFLIQIIPTSQWQPFVLTRKNLHDILYVIAQSKPSVCDSLQLLLAYGILPVNCKLYLEKGIFLYAIAIAYKSSDIQEKEMAFVLMQKMVETMMTIGNNKSETEKANNINTSSTPTLHVDSAQQPEPSKLTHLLDTLCEQIICFKNVISHNAVDNGRNEFQCVQKTLTQLEFFSMPQLSNELLSSLATSVLNILITITEALTTVQENHLFKWLNYIFKKVWMLLKSLESCSEQAMILSLEDINHFIDNMLQAIYTCSLVDRGMVNQTTVMTICYCLRALEEILFGDISLELNLQKLPLSNIRKALLDSGIMTLSPLRERSQIILCHLVTEGEIELLHELCISKDVLAERVKDCSQLSKIKDITVALKKFKIFSKVSENRARIRQLGLLDVLKTFYEEYPDSQVESLAAELVCLLLSDPPDITVEKQNFDEFEMSEYHLNAMHEFVKSLAYAVPAKNLDVYSHAQSLYSVMTVANSEDTDDADFVENQFDLPLLCAFVAKHLKELICIYGEMNRPVLESHIVVQVSSILNSYLPQFVSILLKIRKAHASTQSQDKFIDGLVSLTFSCMENWSRMGSGVQEALVKYGGCHLLLNELYNATFQQILKNGVAILISLYHIILNSEFTNHFQVVLTDKLLQHFLSMEDVRVRCLAKLILSCLHVFLPHIEMTQFFLQADEAELVVTCLKNSTHIFEGLSFLELVATVENLTLCGNNLKIFADTEVVLTLVDLAQTETGPTQSHALCALMNLCLLDRSMSNNSVISLLQSMPHFLQFIENSDLTMFTGLQCLFKPHDEPGLEIIMMLYNLKRYEDCQKLCESLKPTDDSDIVLLYKAKSMYYQYNKNFVMKCQERKIIPTFEYKTMMRSFCNDKIVEVIRILTKIKNKKTEDIWDSEATYILDKALVDCLIFNIEKVKTCLLCHVRSDKLIRSHYISKFILQRSVKAMGYGTGESVVIFSSTDQASDWELKSAAKITFSMLCKNCDGGVLSKDEKAFKECIFDLVYGHEDSHMLAHLIVYGAFFHRFVAGLIFRGIAQFCSNVCAEISQFNQVHVLMQACREACLPTSHLASSLTVYMLPLPVEIPVEIQKPLGWDTFVGLASAPYGAYRLIYPGEPALPKQLYCFMVKVGFMVFVAPLDQDLHDELEVICPDCKICIPFNEGGDCVMNIPEDSKRAKQIPQKLWLTLTSWAQEKHNIAMSVALSFSPAENFMTGHGLADVVKRSADAIQQATKEPEGLDTTLSLKDSPVVANLLPPGFEINFDKPITSPLDVVKVPNGHKVILHSFFTIMSGATGYILLAKLESNTPKEKKEKHSIYSRLLQPYILLYVVLPRIIMKVGFLINEQDCSVKGTLPGCRAEMRDSVHLEQLIERVPELISCTLRAKGFKSFKSLLFWNEHHKDMISSERVTPSLDSTCFQSQKCFYCQKLCDVCMKPCFQEEPKLKDYSTFGIAHCCSDPCHTFLTSETDNIIFENVPESSSLTFTSEGHFEYLRGYFSIIDQKHFGFQSTVFFSICQSGKEVNGYFTVPSTTKYIRLWYWNIYKPLCLEYVVDHDFNPVRLLDFEHSGSVFGEVEEKELMLEHHQLLVAFGVPFHFKKCQFKQEL